MGLLCKIAALARFQAGQAEYQGAIALLQNRPFDLSKLDPPQQQLLLQFLGRFGASSGSDQAAIIRAYAASFERTIASIRDDSPITLARFRDIQVFIGRQILVGTFMSQAMRN